jgi:penicillin-binding protein 2
MSILGEGFRVPGGGGGSRNRPHGNLNVLRVAVVGLFTILVLRLVYMQLINGADYAQRSHENHIRQDNILPTRGEILDRAGEPLVDNVPIYSVTIVPQLLPESEEARNTIYQQVEKISGIPALDMQVRVKAAFAAKTDYISIGFGQNHLTADQAQMLDEAATDMPGVSLTITPGRNYTAGPAFANILGYIGPQRADNRDAYAQLGYDLNEPIGIAGLEASYEGDLRGQVGFTANEQDSQGHPINTLKTKDPVPGNTVKLAIDSGLQNYIAELLQETLQDATWKARNAAAVVMNAKTGAIYAMVSVPDFDPNILAETATHEAEYNALANDVAGRPLVDHATEANAPGSTFKLITASAALENGNITPNTSIDIPNKDMELKDEKGQAFFLHDWRAQGSGINLYKGIAYSSNIYFNMISCGILGKITGLDRDFGKGAVILGSMARSYGLGGASGIDLPDEAFGRIPSPAWKKEHYSGPDYTNDDRSWFYGDTCNMSVGQGDVTATPIQIARMTAAVANGGKLLTPHLADQVLSPDGKVVRTVETQSKQVAVSAEHLNEIRQGMHLGVTDPIGAAHRIEETTSADVAGKTGTAEFFEDGQHLQHAWFTGFAPYSDPEVVVTVYYDLGVGGDKAAPTAGRIFDYFFKNVKP